MDAGDLEALVRELGFSKIRVVNNQKDTNIMICCPWHGESNPSAGISAEKEIGACFSCGKTFGIVELVSFMKDISYIRARDFLEERFNVRKRTVKDGRVKKLARIDDESNNEERENVSTVLPNYALAPYRSGKIYHDYLSERGFSKKICRDFKIGWDESRCRITIPIFNQNNELLGFIVRAVLEEDDPGYKKVYGKTDKYLVDNFQRSLALFPIHLFPKGEKTAILVEGSLDAMKAYQYGFNNVLAVLTSKLSAAQIKLLHKLHIKNVVLAFDKDKAGQEGCIKAYNMLKNDFIVYKVEYPEGHKDMGDMSKEEIQKMLDNKTFYKAISLKKLV